jgi:hypothetical protein
MEERSGFRSERKRQAKRERQRRREVDKMGETELVW